MAGNSRDSAPEQLATIRERFFIGATIDSSMIGHEVDVGLE